MSSEVSAAFVACTFLHMAMYYHIWQTTFMKDNLPFVISFQLGVSFVDDTI